MGGAREALPRAASAILLREADGAEPFEVYLLRRPAAARFAPGAYSFPGGVLDPADLAAAGTAVAALPGGLDAAALHRRMGAGTDFAVPDAALGAALLVCAARELFEEAGVLLAREETGGLLPLDNEARWAAVRAGLLAERVGFAATLREDGLTIAPDDLPYFSHWTTPEGPGLRFDTHFFLAVLPPGQLASFWSGEMAGEVWLGPRAALDRHAAGGLPMLAVQTLHLERFARFTSLAALLAHAREKGVPLVLPTRGADGTASLPADVAECW
jgi:8-oxo-dGTP pyrophosphatase MutT (NUDIX family)